MIRVLLGSALSVLGLGLAAAFVAPTVLATSGVQPMIVGAADPVPEFQPASFDEAACASTLLFAEAADRAGPDSRLRVLAFARPLGSGKHGFELRELPPGASTQGAVILLLVDAGGRILAALEQESFPGECGDVGRGKRVGAI